MRDVELYRHLLGLEEPWTVRSVELNVQEQRVDVWAGHGGDVRWRCRECGTGLALYDHAEERVWRHLDSCQFMTYLHAQPPRVECPTHGVRQVRLPWAEARARFTTLFERLAIDVLKETDIRGATRILRISWDEAWHILERAVERGQRAKCPRVLPHLGVDEKAIAKGHQYVTLVCDLDRSTVEFIAEDRKQASLAGYFTGLSADQLAGIEAIALDMWEPYVQAIRAHVPAAAAKIVFDRYHIMTHMGQAVDDVRNRDRADDPAPPAQRHDLLRSPHHQRRHGRPQLQDPDHQEDGLRLPEPRALQDGHLLPLRRPRPLPGYPRKSRMNHLFNPAWH